MRQEDLKGLRAAKGLTQKEVADRIRVSERTYRRIENMEIKASRDRMSALWPVMGTCLL